MLILKVLLAACELALAGMVAYLLALSFAALWARRSTRLLPNAHSRLAILIPAHNEQHLLPDLLDSLAAVEYPASLCSVWVVADNCDDQTAALARQRGARVHERFDRELVGKGYALQWLLQRVWESGEDYDGFVILDADSLVSPRLLRVVDSRLRQGERAIQAYYTVRDPLRSWGASLRYIALALVHFSRPLGRMVLGTSAGLKGNGMAFAADIIRQHPWSATLTEDIEYHMALILAGERVTFAPDALVWAEMPHTLSHSRTQNARWERGRLQMVKQYVPRLLREAWRKKSYVLLDAAIEQLIPPFSLCAALNALCLALALLIHFPLGIVIALALAVGQLLYVLLAMALARAPGRIYLALIYSPIFVLWKIWLYARVVLGLERQGWLRTHRNAE